MLSKCLTNLGRLEGTGVHLSLCTFFEQSFMTERHPRTMKINNPPSPPEQRVTFGFSKGGMGGFESYFLGAAGE
jgi:hypothetical protein